MSERCNVCHKAAEEHPHRMFCCPRCGAESAAHLEENNYHFIGFCLVCLLELDACSQTFEEAVAAWNHRASPWVKFSERWPEDRSEIILRRWPNLGWVRKHIACFDAEEWKQFVKVNSLKDGEWMAIPE